MMKNYQKPTMKVVKLQHRMCLLEGSPTSVKRFSSNLTGDDAIEYSETGSSESAR